MSESARPLSGKVALVTGASSGIGEATALASPRPAPPSRSPRAAPTARGARRAHPPAGGTALAIETDVSDEAQANAFVHRTHEELGRLDVLVNNAGVMLLGPIEDAPTEEWRRMIDTNVFGSCTAPTRRSRHGEQGGGTSSTSPAWPGGWRDSAPASTTSRSSGSDAFSESLRQEGVGKTSASRWSSPAR